MNKILLAFAAVAAMVFGSLGAGVATGVPGRSADGHDHDAVRDAWWDDRAQRDGM